MDKLDFLSLLAFHMKDIILIHDLVPLAISREPVLERVTYKNSQVAMSCFLDVRDGYVDVRFGPATNLNSDGLFKWPEYDTLKSIGKILRLEGKNVPEGPKDLYADGKLEEAVTMLVQGLRDHEELVFGKKMNGK